MISSERKAEREVTTMMKHLHTQSSISDYLEIQKKRLCNDNETMQFYVTNINNILNDQ